MARTLSVPKDLAEHVPGGVDDALTECLISRLLRVPYLRLGRDWNGADCWGLVEIAYQEAFGFTPDDRMPGAHSCADLAAAYVAQQDWRQVTEPADFDLAVMKAIEGRTILSHGHCGFFWRGGVIHTRQGHGPVYEPCSERTIAGRLQGWWRHRLCGA